MTEYKKYLPILAIMIVFFAGFCFVQSVNADTYDAKPYFSSTGDCAGTTRGDAGTMNSCRRAGYIGISAINGWGDDDMWSMASDNRLGAGYFDTSIVPGDAQIEEGSYIKFRVQAFSLYSAPRASISFYIIDSSEDADWDSNGPSNTQIDGWILDFTLGASTNYLAGAWTQFDLTQAQRDALELHLVNGGVTFKLRCTNCIPPEQISYDTGFYTSMESFSPLFHIVYTPAFVAGTVCTIDAECGAGHCQNGICCIVGQTCCSSDSHCPVDSYDGDHAFLDNYCDTVTDYYCKTNIQYWWYRINSAQAVIIAEHGVCNEATNNNALDIFVPTKTADEWTAFKTYASGMTYASCFECTMGSDCAAGSYCRSSDTTCQVVPVCQIRVEDGYGTTNVTDYNEATGCTTTCKGCYGGFCANISGTQDIWGTNLCTDLHYICSIGGLCTAPCSNEKHCWVLPSTQTCNAYCESIGRCGCRDCTSGTYCTTFKGDCNYACSDNCVCWEYAY